MLNNLILLCIDDSDCEHLSSFFKGYGHEIKTDCCNEPGIECEDAYIKSIDLTLQPGKIDFSNFPTFEKLEKLSIKGDVFGGILQLDELCFAKFLDFSHSSIKEVRDNGFLHFSEIEELNLSDNLLETFPYAVNPYLPKSLILDNNKISGTLYSDEYPFSFESPKKLSLNNNNFTGDFIVPSVVQYLNIENNLISRIKTENYGIDYSELRELNATNNKFDDDVFKQLKKFKNLEKLTLRENGNISNVTESIGKLSELKYLDLSKNNIKELHSNLFILTELKDFNISDNPSLNAKIINFAGSEAIENCNFNNTKISCYQPNTCANINDNYEICSDEEIKSIKQLQTLHPKSFLRVFIKIGVFVISIILIIVLCFSIVCCCCLKKCCCNSVKKNKNKKVIHSSPMYSGNLEMNNINDNDITNATTTNTINTTNVANVSNVANIANNNTYYNNNNNINNLSQNPNNTLLYPSFYISNNTPSAPSIEVVPNTPTREDLRPSLFNGANYSYSYNYSYNNNNNNENKNNNDNNINNIKNNKNGNNNSGSNYALPTYEEATSHLHN
ncbi:L domain-like protein [Anaeromyces robustus]|uniref:L domain-like protein n=1 Tax=Anaeromyces robustus TaxID=1754192 RepID=A0A1Y1X513_9FUNG|nr:L domain-like protein [Anaeromyces robustus]|eukprot:ORX80738.1 L domain-like protein [Anaeromyces robustus]